MKPVRAAELDALMASVRRSIPLTPVRTLYLVSATSHLAERWRDSVPRFELAGDAGLEAVVRECCAQLQVDLTWESPADIIPLPADTDQRARTVSTALDANGGPLSIRHFDPYSVVLRMIARGDEMDYVDSLEYMRRGWVDFGTLEAMLVDVLPRFTNETLAQDPAEFRRKFRGLRQLHLSEVANRHLA